VIGAMVAVIPAFARLAGPLAALLTLGGYLIFRRYDLPEARAGSELATSPTD
jgi:hypothetical protein